MTGNPDIRGVISPVELSEGFVDGGHYYIYKDKLNFHKLGNLLYLHISLLLTTINYHFVEKRRGVTLSDSQPQLSLSLSLDLFSLSMVSVPFM